MSTRLKAASAIFYVVAAWACGLAIIVDFGLIDTSSPPYREALAALASQPDVWAFALIFVGFIGGLLLASALAIVLLVSGPLRRNESRAKIVVVILSVGILIPQLITWTRLGMPLLARSIVATLLVLVVVAALLLRADSDSAAKIQV